jgi:hypothetical protein
MAIAPFGVALVAAGATALEELPDAFSVGELTDAVLLAWPEAAEKVPFVGRREVMVPLTRRVAVAVAVDVMRAEDILGFVWIQKQML